MPAKPPLIYLADLVHNRVGKGPFTFPINIGFVAAYVRARYDDAVDVRLFKFPDELLAAFAEAPPAILGLANYAWNVDLNRKVLDWARQRAPATITVFGGPNFPLEEGDAAAFLAARPSLDIAIEHQGESGFANIVERFLGGATTPDAIRREPIDGCLVWDRDARRLLRGGPTARMKDLDVIPSPYLTGLLDRFFDDHLIPIIETNRGCPYGCTFCAWGNAYLQKVNLFSLDRVRDELRYIGAHVRRTTMLMIADANFGIMDDRDLAIAKTIRELQDSVAYPRSVSAQWAKNKTTKILGIAEVLGESTSVTASFQSLDPTALANVKRSNIKLGTYRDIVGYMNAKRIPSFSEIILGLPGESRQSYLDGLRQLFDLHCNSIVGYNLRLMDGTELGTSKERARFAFRTKYRLLDTMFGRYGDFQAMECEEVVRGTDTMADEDILFFRPLQWLIQMCWNYKYHAELLKHVQTSGVNPLDVFLLMLERVATAPPAVRAVFEDFERESRSEWFDSEEALVAHYGQPDVFDAISRGEFGKLNYKYTFRVLLEGKADFDRYLGACALEVLRARGLATPETPAIVDDLVRFAGHVALDFGADLVTALEQIAVVGWDILGQHAGVELEARLGDTTASFGYDVLKWRDENFAKPLADYRAPDGVSYTFYVPADQELGLARNYRQYQTGNLNLTLRKMTEYTRFGDLFHRVRYTAS